MEDGVLNRKYDLRSLVPKTSSHETIYKILDACKDQPRIITQIYRKLGTGNQEAKEYVGTLVHNGFLTRRVDSENGRPIYRISKKGIQYVNLFEPVNALYSSIVWDYDPWLDYFAATEESQQP